MRSTAATACVDVFDQKTCHSLVDDFRHGAPSEGDHRRPASHGLDHDQAERLRPVDRKKKRGRVAEELRLLPLVDFADELHIRMGVDQRLDDLSPSNPGQRDRSLRRS